MPAWQTMLEVALAGFALSASPGPSMMYVLSRTLGQSRAAGFASSVGLAIGGILLAAISATGLAVLLSESPLFFSIVSLLGACYLYYLAFDMVKSTLYTLRHPTTDQSVPKFKAKPIGSIVRQGILVELLNPKTVLFFIAFLPGFIDTSASEPWIQMCILGMLIPLTAIPSDLIVVMAGGSLRGFIGKRPRASAALELAGAAILALIATRVIFTALM